MEITRSFLVYDGGASRPWVNIDPFFRGLARKFLLFDDGTLIIGPTGSHLILKGMLQRHHADLVGKPVIGAGDCNEDEVIGWKSIGLGLTTPEELHPLILAALGMPDATKP